MGYFWDGHAQSRIDIQSYARIRKGQDWHFHNDNDIILPQFWISKRLWSCVDVSLWLMVLDSKSFRWEVFRKFRSNKVNTVMSKSVSRFPALLNCSVMNVQCIKSGVTPLSATSREQIALDHGSVSFYLLFRDSFLDRSAAGSVQRLLHHGQCQKREERGNKKGWGDHCGTWVKGKV